MIMGKKKRRIFITGDTHGFHNIHKLNKSNFPTGNDLTKDDILIICGDAGFVWNQRTDAREIEWISNRPWTTVYVDGNHEGFPLFANYETVDFFGAKADQISSSLYHIHRGEIMQIDGMSFFCFGGAFSHDIEYRTLNVDWYHQELPTQAEVDYAMDKLRSCQYKVDYVITHDVPTAFNFRLGYRGVNPFDMMKYRNPDVMYIDICSFLQNVYDMVENEIKAWFSGHYHVDKEMGLLRVLLEDIAEIDRESETGYIILENHLQSVQERKFSCEELKRELAEEELYVNWGKIGPKSWFRADEPMISGTDFFEQSVTDNELEWLTRAYNLYTIKKDTFS